jgi:hypothetical protein
MLIGAISKMYLAYTYFLRNKITNQFYYGSRCKNVKLKRTPQEDFWIRYFTSSKKVHNLIKTLGKESFEFQFLLEDVDYNKCYNLEQTLIIENIGKELCLNMYSRSNNKFSTAGKTHSIETKKKISAKAATRVQSAETIEKIKKTTTGKPKSAEHVKNAAAGRKGKKNKKAAWNKGLVGQKGHPNPLKGISGIRTHTQESKNKIGEKHKGRAHTKIICPHCNKEGGCTSMKRWHFDNCKHKNDK